MPSENPVPLGDVATNNTHVTTKSYQRKIGEVIFSLGWTTFVVGALWTLFANWVLRSPELANACGIAAAWWFLVMVPPALAGHLPDLGDPAWEKTTTIAEN